MRQTEQVRTKRVGAMLMVSWLLLACPAPVVFAEPIQSGPELRQTTKAAISTKPGAAGRAKVELPKFPKQFDVQAQGAPVVVVLQSPGGQPIIQKGTGLLRLFYNVTPQDIQRSLFWQIQIGAWCEDDCRTAGQRLRAGGAVMVQHPPVDQAAVQKAIQAIAGQQQPSPQELQQAGAQAATQMEQAFQQRKAQFEQLQQQRRTALFAQIQPQVDQLRGRLGMGAQVRPRGLEETEELKPEGLPGEELGNEGEIGTRAMPRMERPMKLGGMMQPVAPGQSNAQIPAFPQQFAVQGPESASFSFAVTQPGPIQAEVQSQGPPVVVSLQHLASPPMSQQGSGQVRLSYDVTPQDIQRSALWVVRVKLAQAGPPVSGSVIVHHPQADQAVVQAQTAALVEQERVNQARTGAESDAQSHAEFQEFKARFEQQYQQRLAAERAQNQTLLNRLRTPSGAMIRSRGLTPAISRINKSEGQPKTQVIIEGTSFGPGGEVVFQLGPNLTGTAIVEGWSDTLVVANVPDASGLLPYHGTIAIKVGQTLSNAVPFKFVPIDEPREIRTTKGDITVAHPGILTPGSVVDKIEHPNNSFGQCCGSSGNDVFFPTQQLMNGWVVQDIKPKTDPCAYPDCRGTYVADSRIGTSSPYFNMRWWHGALVGSRYWFTLWIVGPRGVPDGIQITGPLRPVIPPGTPPPATTASNTPAERTPPSQPPYTPPAATQPIEMTVVPINPALIQGYQVAPGSGTGTTQSQPIPGQSGTKMAVDPKNTMNPTLHQVPPDSGASTPPQGGGAPMGSGTTTPPQPPGPAAPVITFLSVTQGQPGDPVMISGSNFGSGAGEIHFVIANGRDVKAPAGAIWSDNQIFTSVPDATGLLAFNGQVYIKRAADQKTSNLAVFRFEPTLEVRHARGTMDRILASPYDPHSPADVIRRESYDPFFGYKGNDLLFVNARLKNGWVVEDAIVNCFRQLYQVLNYCKGGAYPWETKTGTNWPYVSVRWWMDPVLAHASDSNVATVWYGFSVQIRGPKGVPDGVVVP